MANYTYQTRGIRNEGHYKAAPNKVLSPSADMANKGHDQTRAFQDTNYDIRNICDKWSNVKYTEKLETILQKAFPAAQLLSAERGAADPCKNCPWGSNFISLAPAAPSRDTESYKLEPNTDKIRSVLQHPLSADFLKWPACFQSLFPGHNLNCDREQMKLRLEVLNGETTVADLCRNVFALCMYV